MGATGWPVEVSRQRCPSLLVMSKKKKKKKAQTAIAEGKKVPDIIPSNPPQDHHPASFHRLPTSHVIALRFAASHNNMPVEDAQAPEEGPDQSSRCVGNVDMARSDVHCETRHSNTVNYLIIHFKGLQNLRGHAISLTGPLTCIALEDSASRAFSPVEQGRVHRRRQPLEEADGQDRAQGHLGHVVVGLKVEDGRGDTADQDQLSPEARGDGLVAPLQAPDVAGEAVEDGSVEGLDVGIVEAGGVGAFADPDLAASLRTSFCCRGFTICQARSLACLCFSGTGMVSVGWFIWFVWSIGRFADCWQGPRTWQEWRLQMAGKTPVGISVYKLLAKAKDLAGIKKKKA